MRKPVPQWCFRKLICDTYNNRYTPRDFAQYGEIEDWDTSRIICLDRAFQGCESFQRDISRWDTRAVKSAVGTFDGLVNFDCDLSGWNTSAMTDMSGMFYRARSFQGKGLGCWDTRAVTRMNYMFYMASAFRGDGLSRWDTRAVTDMASMFHHATAFQEDISRWNTDQVTDMSYMFYCADTFLRTPRLRAGVRRWRVLPHMLPYLYAHPWLRVTFEEDGDADDVVYTAYAS